MGKKHVYTPSGQVNSKWEEPTISILTQISQSCWDPIVVKVIEILKEGGRGGSEMVKQ